MTDADGAVPVAGVPALLRNRELNAESESRLVAWFRRWLPGQP